VLIDPSIHKGMPHPRFHGKTAEVIGKRGRAFVLTPTRVSHRRADKLRLRRVYSADLIEVKGRLARINVKGESGLYIKELIFGDGGRTQPNLAEILRVDAIVEELDVIDVGGESDGTSSWNAEEI